MTRPEQKIAKKMAKALNIVSRQLGIARSMVPNEWVMIWGAGLGLGTPKIDILNFLSPTPSEIRYYDEKPYCTARFDTSTLASACKRARNGLLFHGIQYLYMDFISQVPPPEDLFVLASFETPKPDGLTLLNDFINEEEEQKLLQSLFPPENDDRTNEDTIAQESSPKQDMKLKHRLVRHFGYEFRYETNDVDFEDPMKEGIPDNIMQLFSRMMAHNIIQRKPEQITMNHYAPGQGIPPHVDTHSAFEQPIMSLSMGSSVVMDFQNGEKHFALVVPPRSLLIMRDEARYLWTHGIASRRYDVVLGPTETGFGIDVRPRDVRVSLTFRLLNPTHICNCIYPQMCDSQKARLNEETAPVIEKNLVHKVYDEIAEHFSSTRHTPWPRVKDFLQKIAKGHSVLDVGCGNGKYFNLTDYIYEVGMDMSKSLLQIAKVQKKVDGVRANCLRIPFKDESFDAIICIAVLHHLATKERRICALKEIYRALTPGGHALIYVWAKDQRLKEVKSAYAKHKAFKAGIEYNEKRPSCPPKDYSFLPVHLHEENFRFNDMLVPWLNNTENDTVHHRFYHVFNRGELEDLIGEIKGEPPPQILDSYYDQGNWCVVIWKEDLLKDLAPYPPIPKAPTRPPI